MTTRKVTNLSSFLLFVLGTLLTMTSHEHAVAAPDTTMGLPSTISAGTQVEKLATLPTEPYTVSGRPFTEGTTRAPNGDVYFVEQNSNKIMKWSVADKALSVFMHPAGYANGMAFDAQGNLIACADERNELWSISLTETETIPYPQPLNPAVGQKPTEENITVPAHIVLMDGHYNGKFLGGPNDLWIRPDGGIYFTDPFYTRSWWTPGRGQEQELKTVYFLSPDHRTLTRVLPDFLSTRGIAGTPNGIIGTPDGKTLFVADINGNETWSFDVAPDGALSNKTLVCAFGSDGMTLDDQGNLYMSAGANPPGVTVVNVKSGQQVGFIPVPEQPSNMCFAGKDRQTLYITARTGFYAIPTNVKGANLVK
ncbi:gluconolactonase [Abditibacteriota bacterium]|nr:gluconolactonase [Abditibacteriota bacterium]